MTEVLAIMPCRGRTAQTVANVGRLLETAGAVDWRLICYADGDAQVAEALRADGALDDRDIWESASSNGYWHALASVTAGATEGQLLCNLANDLLPGAEWLQRGVAAYRARFGQGNGLLGFNDGIHGPAHSPHFLISRGLLERLGGWPNRYRHNYGDTELCRRAQALGCYAKAPWAVLYHDHPGTGAGDDAVYQAGRAGWGDDQRLFEARRRAGWPSN